MSETSEDTAESVEPWVEAYLPDFVEIHRMITRTPGFAFQPLELPSPDLARALARWLDERGCEVSTLELAEEGAWATLASVLENLPSAQAPAVFLVIDDGDPPAEGTLRTSLAQVNMGRDIIARRAARTILWCGRARFQRWVGDFAPDLWSVGSSPYFVPLRRVEDLPSSLRTGVGMWWTGASGHDVCDLERAFGSEPEGRKKVEAGLRLAEARVIRGDRLGAQNVLREVGPDVAQQAPLLSARAFALTKAAHDDLKEELAASETRLRREIEAAQQLGAKHKEAQLRMGLAETIVSNNPYRGKEVVADVIAARALVLELGDAEAALHFSYVLVSKYGQCLSEEIVQDVEAQAQRGALGPGATALATVLSGLILAIIALAGQRFEEADSRLNAVIELSKVSPEVVAFEIDARALLVTVALQSGALEQAEEHGRAFLSLAERAELPAVRAHAHTQLARVLAARGVPLAAAKELVEAIDIFADLDDWMSNAQVFRELELRALSAGALQIADLLTASFCWIWAEGPLDADSDWLNPRVKLIESSGLQVPARTQALHESLRQLRSAATDLETREAENRLKKIEAQLFEELESVGADLFDVDTWPVGLVARSS